MSGCRGGGSDMARVSGTVEFAEARKVVPDIQRRRNGMPGWAWSLVPAVVLLSLFFVVQFAWAHIPWFTIWNSIPGIDPWKGERWIDLRAYEAFGLVTNDWFAFVAIWIPLVFLGLMLTMRLQRRVTRTIYRRRGVESPNPVRMTITTEGFEYCEEGLTKSAGWDAVSEVFSSHGYWVFLIPVEAAIIPRRFFATPDAERDFIAEALSFISGTARARSKKAARFAETGKL